MRKTVALATVLTLTLAACSGGGGDTSSDSSTELSSRIERVRQRSLAGTFELASTLRSIGDCDAVLAHLKTEAAARVTAYGLPGIGGPIAYATDARGGPVAMPSAAATGSSTKQATPATGRAGAGGDASSPSFSGTNNQEQGVDEPDLVKTDGRRIVTVANGKLSVVAVTGGGSTAGTPRQVAIGDETGGVTDLLLAGDRALVFGTAWAPDPVTTSSSGGAKVRGGVDTMPAAGSTWATVTEVDLSGAEPKVGATLRIEGAYLTARLIDTTVRLVVRSEPQQLPFVTPQNQSGEARARKANEEVVLQSTLEDWLPSYEIVPAGGTSGGRKLLTDCARVEAPSEFAGFGSLSVLTLDAAKPLTKGDAVSVLADGQTVYASDANLYVATQTWVDPTLQSDSTRLPVWQQSWSTSIHQFSIAGTAPAAYLGSGQVPGHLLDQFSMSEHKGVLRVATTKGVPWGATETSESMVVTMRRDGEALREIGRAGGLGKGERIYAVRFEGDTAYVVTFRQTDPFYTLDLADPTAPKVLGELKITGYSGYLHPIDGDLVIGVGQEASSQGRVQGTKVSLFDVQDLANPVELAKWTLPGSSSGAEWDHHAFLWWPATKTLVLPVQQYDGAGDNGGAYVLQVDRAKGITPLGKVSHAIEKPADLGKTDCRALPASVVAKGATGAGYDAPPGVLVLVCESGRTGAVGYSCNTLSSTDLGQIAPKNTVQIPDGGHLEYCYPTWNQPQPVLRSLVIGSSLWTLSTARLQANDLGDLRQTARVGL